jgi:predicted RNA-binding protein with TRAM domain
MIKSFVIIRLRGRHMLQKGGKYRFTVIGITQDGCGIGMVEGLKVFIDGGVAQRNSRS